MAKSEEGSSTNTGPEKGKYEHLEQSAFEKKMQKEMLDVVKRTDKLARQKYAGGVPDEPKDEKGGN
jgi:hypothetical protein